MTLLLALSCDSFVMQVSDRRLSVAHKPLPGEWNKAVVWCNIASIAYTGNAYRDRDGTKQVDDWITEVVGAAGSVDGLYALLINGAIEWLESVRVPHPQAFSLAGWAPQVDGTYIGYVGLVSNFHDQNGNLRAPTTEFTWLRAVRNKTAKPRSFFLSRTGATVRPEEFRAAVKGIKRVMKDDGDPARVADLLAQVIRHVSKRDPTIGEEVMITCLPRPTGTENDQFFTTSRSGRPGLDNPSFFYRGTSGDDSVSFAPQTVCAHVVQTIERIRYHNASGSDADIVMSVRILPSHPIHQTLAQQCE